MNFACDKCQKRYSIADEKVRGRTVKIRCKHCQNIISVQGPSDADLDEPATSMFSAQQLEAVKAQDRALSQQDAARTTRRDEAGSVIVEGQWFAMVKGKQVGPLDGRQLQAKAKSSEITNRTYLWKEGMADWKRAADLPEMASIFGDEKAALGLTPPPPPPVAALTSRSPARSTTQEISAAVLEVPAAKQNGAQPLAELFTNDEPSQSNGVNGHAAHTPVPARAPAPASPGKAKPRSAPVEDPFAALGELDPSKLPPAGESTSFFIAQAGVNKRNPPWKIATFIGAIVIVPVVTLYLLSELKVVPLKIKRVDEAGQEVEQSVFSADGVSGLGDLLLGRNKKKAKSEKTSGRSDPTKDERPNTVTAGGPSAGAGTGSVAQVVKDVKPKDTKVSSADLAALYGDASKRDVGPEVRKGADEKAKDTATGGLAEAEVAKVVGQNQPAFQSCIEQEMRKNPNFKGGKVNIVATVANSGVVTHAQIDRNDIDRSGLGDCLKSRAKRMVFSAFAGDETELQIPLILSGTL